MRPIWTGSIAFGLVNIPVRLYSASRETALSFNLLHKKDLGPIRYARVCREDGHEIAYEDIVKGYEYQKGDFVVLEDEDFQKANVKKTKTIDIQEFTNESEIDPMYFDKPYYLEPDPRAKKAYVLLREALKRSKKVAVAKYVLRNKERVCVLKVSGNILVLDQMRYADEIRRPEELDIPSANGATNKEIEMALKIIDQLSGHFNMKDFKDTYTEELKDVIEQKAKGKKIKAKGKALEPTGVPDLMKALRASLERGGRQAPKKARPRTVKARVKRGSR
jgi:DNA end-binding protein Ku